MARRGVVLGIVSPFVYTHFCRQQVNAFRRAISLKVFALTHKVNTDRRLMRMCGRPNDVLRTKGAVTTEKYFGIIRLQGDFIQNWAIPFVEFNT